MNNPVAARFSIILLATGLAFTVATTADAEVNDPCLSCDLSNASRSIPAASGQVLQGSLVVAGGSGLLVVGSVTVAGEGSILALKGIGNGVQTSVRVMADVGKQLSQAVGQSVQVVAVSTGNLLVMSGRAIAFIPNELGQALLRQNKLD